jgi:hypothetical protein
MFLKLELVFLRASMVLYIYEFSKTKHLIHHMGKKIRKNVIFVNPIHHLSFPILRAAAIPL